MACFIASGAAARTQQLTALTDNETEQRFFANSGAIELPENWPNHKRFVINQQQYKEYMQWKQERSIAMKKVEAATK